MNPFDFVKSINSHENIMLDKYDESEYVPFIVNRNFSLFPDTIFYAAEMNKNSHVDKRMQYLYYLYSISPRKRYQKWPKKRFSSEDVSLISSKYKYSHRKAKEVLKVLTPEQLDTIRKQQEEGG